ncbi:hypothetical protein BGZ57DRAFT_925827 [Hyaloscypha finlandica]|nr:hypothetical protein BGZ57DRAFT_925827 [Hyaloscypha finlandica]
MDIRCWKAQYQQRQGSGCLPSQRHGGITAVLVAVLVNQNRRVALPRQGIAVRPLSQRHGGWCREGKCHRIVGLVQWVEAEDDNGRDGLQEAWEAWEED